MFDPSSPNAPTLVYATPGRAPLARQLLRAACQATGAGVRLEVLATGALFRRLHPDGQGTRPDLLFTSGPYMAQAAARDGFLQAFQPRTPAPDVPGAALHAPDWGWIALDFSAFTVVGNASLATLDEATTLAVPDPARSEDGVMLLLAMLDAARQRGAPPEQVWQSWERRARAATLLLSDVVEDVVPMVQQRRASHAVLLGGAEGSPLAGLPPIPNAVGLTKDAVRDKPARALLEWLVGPEAAGIVAAGRTLSPWHASANGLGALAQAAPPLDLDWTFAQYRATRQTWLERGLSPVVGRQ